ncbi:MAG: DUF4097 family beta strand repeat protein [Deltaproteobacteria bacterium]|nr:DUF4097 family beta strand repeat protein [Deltaproteobacteria bacterium]
MSRTSVLLAAATFTTGCAFDYTVEESTEQYSFEAPIHALHVDVESGGIEVIGTEHSCASVEEVTRFSRTAPRVEVFAEDGVLHVRSRCPNQRACSTDFLIGVPHIALVQAEIGSGGVRVAHIDEDMEILTGSGAIEVSDSAGILDLETGSGAIVVEQAAGALYAYTGSGAIDIMSFYGQMEVETGSGGILGSDIEAWAIEAVTGSGAVEFWVDGPIEDLDVETGSGEVDLHVPAGEYRLRLHTGAGSVNVEDVQDQSGADGSIRVETGSGHIWVTGE